MSSKAASKPCCQLYLRGHCHYGDFCKYAHPPGTLIAVPAPSSPSGSSLSSSDDGQVGVVSSVCLYDTSLDDSYTHHLSTTSGRSRMLSMPIVSLKETDAGDTSFPLHMTSSPTSSASGERSTSTSPSPSPTAASNTASCYPVRAGVSDCQYYLKTGKCNYGARCKFNHPHRDEKLVNALNRRDCFDFVQTGTCPYGKSCKYNHPTRSDDNNSSPNCCGSNRAVSAPIACATTNAFSAPVIALTPSMSYATWQQQAQQNQFSSIHVVDPTFAPSHLSNFTSDLQGQIPRHSHECARDKLSHVPLSNMSTSWCETHHSYMNGNSLSETESDMNTKLLQKDPVEPAISFNSCTGGPSSSCSKAVMADTIWTRNVACSRKYAWDDDNSLECSTSIVWTPQAPTRNDACTSMSSDFARRPWGSSTVSPWPQAPTEAVTDRVVGSRRNEQEKSYMPFATNYGASLFSGGVDTWAPVDASAESLFDKLSEVQHG